MSARNSRRAKDRRRAERERFIREHPDEWEKFLRDNGFGDLPPAPPGMVEVVMGGVDGSERGAYLPYDHPLLEAMRHDCPICNGHAEAED